MNFLTSRQEITAQLNQLCIPSPEESSAYQFLAPFPTIYHLFTGAELPLAP